MDKLDKLTTFVVAALVLYGTVLLVLDSRRPVEEKNRFQRVAAAQSATPAELERKIQLAKTLLAGDNIEKSELLVDALLDDNPFEGKLYMLKGDILLRRQQPVAAMYQYREAIGLNPDFLDKKTPLFQGKKIKVTVEEAMAAIEAGLRDNPGDRTLKTDRETVYYMKRKLAGSCG